MKLSAVMIVSDEEAMLRPCLESLAFVDEIVAVVQTSSTDGTEKMLREYTEHVHLREFDTFGKQRNFGIEQASGDWIFSIDADERVPPALGREIRGVVDGETAKDGFDIRRPEFFLGQEMKYGGWAERIIRLVRREKARYERDIHEVFVIAPEKLGHLENPLWHFANRTMGHHLQKMNVYPRVQAEQMFTEGHPPVTRKSFFVVTFRMLWLRLVKKRAYKDGVPGVIESFHQASLMYLAYAMLWEKQQRATLDERYATLEKQLRAKK